MSDASAGGGGSKCKTVTKIRGFGILFAVSYFHPIELIHVVGALLYLTDRNRYNVKESICIEEYPL